MILRKDRRWFPNPARVGTEAIQIIRAAKFRGSPKLYRFNEPGLLIQLHQRGWPVVSLVIVINHHLGITMDENRIGDQLGG